MVPLVKLAIIAATFNGAFSCLLPLFLGPLQSSFGGLMYLMASPRFISLMFCLPSILCFARMMFFDRFKKPKPFSWIVLLWMASSFFWVDPTERIYGYYAFLNIFMAFAFSVLVYRYNLLGLVIRSYVRFSIIAVVVVLLTQIYSPESVITAGEQFRFGRLLFDDGDRIGGLNPNSFTNQLGFCFLLAVYLNFGRYGFSLSASFNSRNEVSAYIVLIPIAIVAAASRGAMFAMILSFIYGARAFTFNSRFLFKSLISTVLVISTVFTSLYFFAHDSVLESLQTRLISDSENLMDFGGRLEIWGLILSDAVAEMPILLGVGLGGVDKYLGTVLVGGGSIFTRSSDDIIRVNSHNLYIDWLLSFGLIGTIVGIYLVYLAIARARQLDRILGAPFAAPLLLYILLTSFVSTIYREEHFYMTLGILLTFFLLPLKPREA